MRDILTLAVAEHWPVDSVDKLNDIPSGHIDNAAVVNKDQRDHWCFGVCRMMLWLL